MSQEKVDRYKEQKKNRKADMKKAKRNKALGILLVVVICAAIVVWAGVSAKNYIIEKQPTKVTDINLDATVDYLGNLGAE